MKKLIALLLCVLLVASMSVTAFAGNVEPGDIKDENGDEGEQTGTVKVKVVDAVTGEEVGSTGTYNVQIKWVGLTFKLEVTNPKENVVWNGNEYTITGGQWDDETHSVTVTNYSDAKVAISAAFSNGKKTSEKKHEIAASIDEKDKVLNTAVNNTPDSTMYTISLDNTPNKLPELKFDVDVITITVQTVTAP